MKRFPIRNVRNDFDKIVTLAKIASIVPITDACLECDASAVKCIKSRHEKRFFQCTLSHFLKWGSPRGKRDGVIRHILERENGNWIKNCITA